MTSLKLSVSKFSSASLDPSSGVAPARDRVWNSIKFSLPEVSGVVSGWGGSDPHALISAPENMAYLQ
jgi:hypothetical protein